MRQLLIGTWATQASLSFCCLHSEHKHLWLIDRKIALASSHKVANMKLLFSSLPGFIGRHWLRLIIVGFALFVLTKKQINFNIRLGDPVPEPAATPAMGAELPPVSLSDAATPEDVQGGLLSKFNLFGGGGQTSRFDALARIDEATIEAFIRRFSNVATAEQEKFGIPASIILANSLLHSLAGTGEAAKQYNNFMGLPCTADWSGLTGNTDAGCVRSYASAWTSFRDHSLYLTSGKFTPLKQFSNSDYRKWAAGLEELNFSEGDALAQQLVRTIDKYQLFRFD